MFQNNLINFYYSYHLKYKNNYLIFYFIFHCEKYEIFSLKIINNIFSIIISNLFLTIGQKNQNPDQSKT